MRQDGKAPILSYFFLLKWYVLLVVHVGIFFSRFLIFFSFMVGVLEWAYGIDSVDFWSFVSSSHLLRGLLVPSNSRRIVDNRGLGGAAYRGARRRASRQHLVVRRRSALRMDASRLRSRWVDVGLLALNR